jgi:hypothetical protein
VDVPSPPPFGWNFAGVFFCEKHATLTILDRIPFFQMKKMKSLPLLTEYPSFQMMKRLTYHSTSQDSFFSEPRERCR